LSPGATTKAATSFSPGATTKAATSFSLGATTKAATGFSPGATTKAATSFSLGASTKAATGFSFGTPTRDPATTSTTSTTNFFGSKSALGSPVITVNQPFDKPVGAFSFGATTKAATGFSFGSTTRDPAKTSTTTIRNVFGSKSALGSPVITLNQPFSKPVGAFSFGATTKAATGFSFGSTTRDPAKTSTTTIRNVFGSKSAFGSFAVTTGQLFSKSATTAPIFESTTMDPAKPSATSATNTLGLTLSNNRSQLDVLKKSLSFKRTPRKPHISSCYSHKPFYGSTNNMVNQSTSAG